MSGYVVGPEKPQAGTHEHLMAGDNDFATFDPNNLQGTKVVWGTYHSRKFKTYNSRQAALSAFAHWGEIKLYFLDPDGWHLAAVKSHFPKQFCDRCGDRIDPLVKGAYGYGSRWRWALRRTPGGKIVHPLVCECLCGKGGCA